MVSSVRKTKRVVLFFQRSGLIWLLAAPLVAQGIDWKPETTRLEEHLVRWPCFERPFNQLVERWHDASGWKHLDAHFEGKQGINPRYRVLRGMLAERLGNFAAASAHYGAVAPNDDWAGYHRARMFAFTGETDAATKELDALVRRTGDSYLFRLAATGIAELIMLREDFAAADRFYTSLWEVRTELRMRLALVEPLLSVKNELGTGDEWLATLNPDFPDGEGALPVSEVEKALLWLSGDSLGRFQRYPVQTTYFPGNPALPPFPSSYLRTGSPLVSNFYFPEWFDTFFARSEPSRWFAEADEEFQYASPLSPDAVIKAIADRGDAGDALFWRFYSDAARSCRIRTERSEKNEAQKQFQERARSIRGRLRERPWIAASTFQMIVDPKTAKETHDFLAGEIFDGIDDPVWRFHSLLLRIQSGEGPDALRQDALQLWRAIRPEEVYNLFRECPNGTSPRYRMAARDPEPYYGTSARHDNDAGVTAPSTGIVWNLRGAGFVEAMRVRFPHGLQIEMFAGGSGEGFSTLVQPQSVTAAPDQLDKVYSIARIDNGASLLRKLWRLRDQLGLGEVDLGEAGGGDGDLVPRAVDVIVRFDRARVRAFALAEPDLASLPGYWTRELRKLAKSTDYKASDKEAELKSAAVAGNRIDAIVASRHPDWFVSRFIAPGPANALTAPDPVQLRQWLADLGKLRSVIDQATTESIDEEKAFDRRWKDFWGRLVPGVAEDSSNSLAVVEARRALARESLPHPLWGLEWVPSITRESRILSAAYELKPRDPAFLTDRLPELVRNPPESNGQGITFDPDHVLFRTTVKLVTAFGDEVRHPPSEREEELRPYAAKYPFVADLLSFRSSLSTLPPSPRYLDYGFNVAELDEALRVLESSGSTRSKMVLASIHHHYGDRTKSKTLAETLAKADRPAGAYLEFLNSKAAESPAVVPNTTAVPKQPERTREKLVARATSILKDAEAYRHPQDLLVSIVANDEEKRWLYEWLKTEVKDDPAFARQAGLMAELARVLNLPEADIAAAEALDQRLNQNGADFWMRRREDLANQEVEALIEAVKRTDFATKEGQSAWWDRMPSLERVVEAKRAGDLASAFGTAVRQNPAGSGEHLAAEFFERVLDGLVEDRSAEDRDERIRRLLAAVFEHQRQLFLWNYDTLFELSENLERGGDTGLATILSRLLLRGAWARKTIDGVEKSSFPSTGQRHDLSAWSEGSQDEIKGKATILPLFDRALRGDGIEEFVDALWADARANPNDEYLLSCALMVQAKRGPLSAEALALLEKSEAQAAMRVAWRLCEHGPPENVRLAELVPALERGLTSIFEDQSRHRGSGSRHYLLAKKVLPWIERGGGIESIRRLVPRFVEHAEDLYFPSTWEFAAVTTARWGDPAALAEIAENWGAHCEDTLTGRFRTDWTLATITALTETTAHAGENGSAFAALSHQVWNRFNEVYGATTDLPADAADRVGASLLATGDRERLSALASSIELQIRIGGDPALDSVSTRLRTGLALLAEKDPALPLPDVWIDPAAKGGEPAVLRWRFSPGRVEEPNSAAPLNAILYGRIQVSDLSEATRFSPPLTSLAGRYDLEVFTGASPSGFRSAAKIPLAAASGSMELRDLPASGWVKGVLRVPGSERVAFGEAMPFANSAPLFDSSMPRGDGARTDFEGTGYLLGGPADIETGASLLLKVSLPKVDAGEDAPDLASGLERLFLLGLDDQRKPLSRISLAELVSLAPESFSVPDGGRIVLLKSTQLWESRRHRDGMSAEEGGTEELRPIRSVALVEQSRGETPLPRIQVWAVPPDPLQSPPAAALPLLEHKVVAPIGFDYDSWHFSGKVPRAAFSGKERLSVFDTSSVPWKPVLEMTDPRIRANERIFILDEDSLCLSQWRADTEKGCAIFVLRWKDAVPASLDAAVKTELPFDPISGPEGETIDLTSTEYVPDGNGILLLAGGNARPLRLVWIDSGGKVTSGQIDRPLARSDGPKLAWWGNDGNFAVWEKRLLHHFQRSPEALVPGRIEEAPFVPKEIPEGAMRGRGFNRRQWSLKRPDLLVRRNPEDGSPLDGFRLRVPCLGLPISLGGDSKEVFLETSGQVLISVEPAPGGD